MSPAPDAAHLRSIIAVASEIAAARLDLDGILALVAARATELTGAQAGAVQLAGAADSEDDRLAEMRSLISVPLLHRDVQVGVLKVMAAQEDAFDEGDTETLELLSGLVAAHLTYVPELEPVQDDDYEDELTGLPGPAAFKDALRSEVARASRYGLRLSLALLEVDRLERLYELHGREAANGVLLSLSEVLRGIRASDLAFRASEDQFALLLTNTPYHAARTAAERAAADVGACGMPAGRVTLTVGVAEARSADPPGLIASAQAALERAKDRRRGLRAA